MKKHWSDSKFADWLRGTKRIESGTIEEWNVWAKQKPIRYWLAEDGLDYIQCILCFPITIVRKRKYYFINRWVNKTHALTSTLKRGKWHDLDERILYCLFNELVNFIEIDLANKNENKSGIGYLT